MTVKIWVPNEFDPNFAQKDFILGYCVINGYFYIIVVRLK